MTAACTQPAGPAAAAVGGASPMQACRVDAMPSDWAGVQVLALRAPRAHSAALARAAARQQARQLLRQRAGDAFADRLLELPAQLRGAQRVSISHDTTVSLLAWCAAGAVGVDVCELASLANASTDELVATAALYLGPRVSIDIAAAAAGGQARATFALHWTALEARLKCLGMQLGEWQPEQARRLAAVSCVRIRPVDGDRLASSQWVGCIAWHDDRAARAGDRERAR